MSAEQTQALLDRATDARRYLRAVRAMSDIDESEASAPQDHELHQQILLLALEAWWREEISKGRLLEVGRLLDIEEETILELID